MNKTKPIRIAIHGAAGRMGQRLVALGCNDSELKIVAAIEADSHPRLGYDAGDVAGIGKINIVIADTLACDADAVIDFSSPTAVDNVITLCVEKHIPLVLATTGLSPEQQQRVKDSAKLIPVLWSPSMSQAVILTMKLSQIAAEALRGSDADVEIIERHHRYKVDAPSGTALKFGEKITAVMGQSTQRHGRDGKVGERPHNEIGYHAIRCGDNVGEHTIVFGMLGETLELTVKASNRDCYALGALIAAKYLHGKPPALYSMEDVLGL
ncbi:MAG: 4-hydroxy-tetrahydrodipicolinate reductase [Planctomycetaceae bacterium]|jgi:4-hydroxy-tetrahydrodipicolinate reductase|nr:4-hydroxy-tetrahydrodipicolinate reductase [Planctomycetaceae bacterium]